MAPPLINLELEILGLIGLFIDKAVPLQPLDEDRLN